MSSHDAYLRTALMKYQYPDIAKRDVLNTFRSFTDLRPNLDNFVFNDGNKRQLLCLEGTIPVNYKGSTYNIPVCFWLMDTHPYNPPMVYVRPTSTMQIKPGRHVDNNGKVFLPYLHEWKHPQSDLLGLIQVLAIVFGEEPPVFSRSAAGGPNPSPRPYQPPTGQTPYPSAGGYMPMPSVGPAANNPPYSGYPGAAPTSYPQSTSGGYPQQTGSTTYPASSSTQYQRYPTPAASTGYQAPGYPGQAPSYPAQSGYPSYPGPAQQTYPQQQTNVGSSSTGSHPPLTSTQSVSLSDDQIKASLKSAVEDKMRRRLKEIWAQAQAEMDVLKKTQEDLTIGKSKLETMIENLEKEQNEVERNITLLKEKDEEIKEVLNKMEDREDVNIDEAVVPTAPLYKQLLNSFSEEQSTEDAIYYLGEALRRGVIDLDVFLKKVRELSRKQFMLRALIHKGRQTAGLPEIVNE